VTEQRGYEVVRGRVVSVRLRVLEVIELSEMMGWGIIGEQACYL